MKRILLAGSDPTLSAAVHDSLAAAGYETRLAAGADEALEVLRQPGADLVLLDGRLDGAAALCDRIRAAGATPLVVLLPASADRSAAGPAFLEAGADYLLPAPFDRRELLARVQVVFRRQDY